MAESASGGVDRRGFFKIVGVSGAAAVAAGCGKTTETLLPYVIPPENIVPGVATWYATVCRECPAGCGALAKVREGRVVKLEGNPDHPVNRGTLCARGQASILGTYDPDRVARPRLRDGEAWKTVSVAEARKVLVEKLQAARQAGPGRIAMLTGLETGTLGRLMDEWLRVVGGRPRVAFEPFAHEDLRAANRLVFGLDAIPYHAFEDAQTILSLGADYLETWLSPVGYAGGFRRAHALRENAPGAVVIHVEPRYSMTAANADEWVTNAPGTEGAVALALLRIVMDERWHAPLPAKEVEAIAGLARGADVEAAARESGIPAARLRRIAERLAKGGPSLVVGGGTAAAGPGATEAQVCVSLLNYALGNVGKTVRFGPNSALSRASRYADLVALTQAMARGQIAVLLVKDANPVYALPPGAGFVDALAKVPTVVSLSSHPDETTVRAHLIVPDLTPLESWGDYVAREGAWGLIQPAMAPVPEIGRRREDGLDIVLKRPGETFPGVDTLATGDLLLDVGRALVPGSEKEKGPFAAKTWADYLREAWRQLGQKAAPSEPFDAFWEAALQRGGFFTDVPSPKVALPPGLRAGGPPAGGERGGDLALMVVPSTLFYDGRSANKAWLHETPDPMLQVVYGTAVEVSAETARNLAVKTGDVVRVESPQGSLEAPAWVSDTLEARTVAILTGLGHTAYGRFATGAHWRPGGIGRNPMALLAGEADPVSGGLRWGGVRVKLSKTGRFEKLASPAGVTEIDPEREIFGTIPVKEALEAAHAGRTPEHANLPSMYPDLKYPEHRWGLSIDLDACTGCQACVVACQAENNVPLVGKANIDYGRAISWLRVERWWDRGEAGASTAAGPAPRASARARFLPMLCQHCEVAPCEPVCPVFAAYHTSEGLNAQVYNRCVGTRYCGNNCPYMVRRFNWYRFDWPAPMTLQLNPDVAVRDRGVMEKCTMCLQRILAGKDQARTEGRPVKDGDIMTACQQTCPTQAITFGDLKDGRSRVSGLSTSARGYHVLEELGTRPAVTYLKKVERGERA
jgi:anaerobic selenocysteine-containing dehydrogenase/Fe-S-cluster-containing dehydrogenase component